MRSQRDAIGRRTIHAVGLEVAQANASITERPRGSNSVAHGRLLHIGRDDAHFAKARGDLREANAGAVDAVIVRNQDSHLLYQ